MNSPTLPRTSATVTDATPATPNGSPTTPSGSPTTPNDVPLDASLGLQWSVELATRRATLHLARRVAQHVKVGDLVILVGPLGAGKTFFVRGLARALGLPSSEPVTSPTFALVQELPTKVPVVHSDLYRLTKADEVEHLGLRQARETACLFVEWGKPFIAALGGDALVLELTRSPRFAHFSATGERSRELLAALRAG